MIAFRPVAIVATALALRLSFLALIAPGIQIDNDGTEYARAMDSLRHGLGYVGMRGTTLDVFPPLYPALIGLVSVFTGNDEVAGRAISIVAGSTLPLAIFLITRLLFGRYVAVIGGMIAACCPYFVTLSTEVLTDQSYVTLVLFGLYALMRTAASPRWKYATLSGAMFGLGYLLRPEALLEAGAAFVVLIVVWAIGDRKNRGVQIAGTFVAAVAVFVVPYVSWISVHAGRLELEQKSATNYAIGTRLNAGMTYWQAADGIDDDLRPYGAELNDVEPPPSPSLAERFRFALLAAPHQAFAVVRTLIARNVLTPLGLMFAAIGFARSWRGRRRKKMQWVVMAVTAAAFASLLSVMHFWSRYDALLVAIAIPWTAKGLRDLLAIIRAGPRMLWVALIVWPLVILYPDVVEARKSQPLEKDAGLWLRQQAHPGALMAPNMIAGYYAGARVIVLPYTVSQDTALRYISKMKPAYVEVVFHPPDYPGLPYVRSWMDKGIPDPRAKLVYDRLDPRDGSRMALYRWHS